MSKAHDTLWRGGARVGAQEYYFLLAELQANPAGLTLRLADDRQYVFRADQVVKIESWPCCGGGRLPSAGLRIHHRVEGYPELIVFAFLCADPKRFVKKLNRLGFGRPPVWRRLLGLRAL